MRFSKVVLVSLIGLVAANPLQELKAKDVACAKLKDDCSAIACCSVEHTCNAKSRCVKKSAAVRADRKRVANADHASFPYMPPPPPLPLPPPPPPTPIEAPDGGDSGGE